MRNHGNSCTHKSYYTRSSPQGVKVAKTQSYAGEEIPTHAQSTQRDAPESFFLLRPGNIVKLVHDTQTKILRLVCVENRYRGHCESPTSLTSNSSSAFGGILQALNPSPP